MWFAIGFGVLVLGMVCYDLVQKRHAILRNFPIIGHFRYWLEAVGPELRQYIVTDNDEERPFSRDERRWVYASAKQENNYFGFGSDNDMEKVSNYLILKQSPFPLSPPAYRRDGTYDVPCAKLMGGYRGRAKAFRPASVVNVSGMSFGSLGKNAILALNKGCALAPCLHNTGEGAVSSYHLHGGELVWQIGTGYFGCRAPSGGFSLERFKDTIQQHDTIRAIEVKLSQGAKPGLGGMLPGEKVTAEIARVRGIEIGKDCISPSGHTVFKNIDGLLDFVELLAEESGGLPVGIKSAVGLEAFWRELADIMAKTGRGPDFITIDGGEGGTGAAPLAFSDHMALPFKTGFARVYRIFAEAGLHETVVFNGSGRLGFPENAALAFILGCDTISVGREAMMAIGCIQAQRCHTGHCPTGVATHNKWLMRGLDPTSKAARLANYIRTLRKELLHISHACGVEHPALLTGEHAEILDGRFTSRPVEEVFGYPPGLAVPSGEDIAALKELVVEAD